MPTSKSVRDPWISPTNNTRGLVIIRRTWFLRFGFALILFGTSGCQTLPSLPPQRSAEKPTRTPATTDEPAKDAASPGSKTREAEASPSLAAFKDGRWTQASTKPTSASTTSSTTPTESNQQPRWRHPGVDQAVAAKNLSAIHAAIDHVDPVVATNGAIALARLGDEAAVKTLQTAIESIQTETDQRCAAIEALGATRSPAAEEVLAKLLSEQPAEPEPDSAYQSTVHAELLRSISTIRAQIPENQLNAAIRSDWADVRGAVLRWYAVTRHPLPLPAIDLRTDPDTLVRIAAIEAIAACQPNDAETLIAESLHDTDFRIRLTAIAGLGALRSEAAKEILQIEMKDSGELIRVAAIESLDRCGDLPSLVVAASDSSWRVRKAVAAGLAEHPTRETIVVAERLVRDPSPEVERAAVESIAAWPLEQGGRLLLAACDHPALLTRQLAAKRLGQKWPPAKVYSATAPAQRRSAMLQQLNGQWAEEFGVVGASAVGRPAMRSASTATTPEDMAEIRRIVTELSQARTRDRIEPRLAELRAHREHLVANLTALRVQESAFLHDDIYSQVLAEIEPTFELLEDLKSRDANERRRASSELATHVATQSLGPLAMMRLAEQMPQESDQAVWTNTWRCIADDASEPAFQIAYCGLRHASPEVRRQACQYLGAHPLPRHAAQLTIALEDSSPLVARGAAQALGRCGSPEASTPLRKALAARDPLLRFEAGASLARLGDEEGFVALERYTVDSDAQLRQAAAKAMGEIGDARFVSALVKMLDDRDTIRRVALESLAIAAGSDVGRHPGELSVSFSEQAARWKTWWQSQPPQ